MKKVRLIPHAEGRLKSYGVNRELVIDAINNPDEVVRGKRKGEIERWIAYKLLDDEYMLRVIYEFKNEDINNVITLYISKRERYYKGGKREDQL